MKGSVILLFVVCAAAVRAQVDECPEEQEDDWGIEMLLRHEDCDKFYMCTFGKPVAMQCPADLYFNLETWQCDWRENVDCTDRYVPEDSTTPENTNATTTSAPTSTTTTPTPTTTTTTAAPTTTSTTTTTTTPAPTTTSSTTTTTTPRPTTTSTTTTTTPRPTTTSTTSTTTPAPATTSSTTTTTTPRPTTTSTTTTTTPRPTTTSTTTTTTPRPTTTSTTTTTTPAPTTTTESPEIEFQPNGCPVDPLIHWLLPHETDCNAFYYCVWGQLVQRECPSGLHFNRIVQVCDWPRDAGCPVTLNKHLNSR